MKSFPTKTIIRWFFLVFISLTIMLLASGIGETLSPWSQAFVNVLSAYGYDSSGREKHTVVLFRENDLVDKVTGEITPFPVPYHKHIEILDQIARHGPKAILVDFSFLDNRVGDDVSQLVDQLCLIHHHKVNVYLSTFKYFLPNHGIRKELYLASFNKDPINGCFKIVPVEYTPEINGVTHTFELFQSNQNQIVKSAPLELYLDNYVAKQPSKLSFTPKMDIVWGWKAPDKTKTDQQCESFSLISALIKLSTKGPLSFNRGCPYGNTLDIHNVLYESSKNKHALIHNKVVLYGGNFDGSSDYVNTPASGTVPGVYLLDMVLDNLVVFGASYKKIDSFSIFNTTLKALWIDVLIIALGVSFYMFKNIIHSKFMSFICFTLKILSIGRSWVSWHLKKILSRVLKFNNRSQSKAQPFIKPNIDIKQPQFNSESFLWIIFVLFLSLASYLIFDLGPRNFLAFVIFIGITTKIDKWIILHTSRMHSKTFKVKLTDHFVLLAAFVITAIFALWVFENSYPFIMYFLSIVIFCFFQAVLAIVFSLLCWTYEGFKLKKYRRFL